jgi:pyruvate dehydrogenase E1 component beta subunit
MESEQMYGDKGEVPEEEYLIPIGKADIKHEGSDVTIVSFGKIMKVALAAAEELAADEQVRKVYLGQNFELRRK